MHTGTCLCGTIHYEIDGPIGAALYCHCSRCRKANGAAFAVTAPVAAKDLRFVAGEASLKSFSTAEGIHRVFCAECGSPILSRRDSAPDVVRLRVGSLNTPLPQAPSAHIFVGSKAEWFEIHDGLPQHAERPVQP